MTTKLPTVDIKGKEYVLVKDRILAFNATFPGGSIETELLSRPEDDRIVVRAKVSIPMKAKINGDGEEKLVFARSVNGEIGEPYMQTFTGHSQAVIGDGYINKTSALENAETSAVGRALAMMGIGVIDSIASADEIKKTTHTLNKITSGQKFTADELEDAVQYAPDEAFGAVKEANTAYRAANPPVPRNPGVKYGKVATANRLREAKKEINNQYINPDEL